MAAAIGVLSGVEPRACWAHFEHVSSWAAEHGFELRHSPDERVNTPTVERFWRVLAGIVDEFSAA